MPIRFIGLSNVHHSLLVLLLLFLVMGEGFSFLFGSFAFLVQDDDKQKDGTVELLGPDAINMTLGEV